MRFYLWRPPAPMHLHREGTPTLLLSTTLLCFLLFAAWRWMAWSQWLLVSLTLALLVVYAIVVLFFRVPRRVADADENSVVAPADGKVVAIEEVTEGEYFQDRRRLVSIFMSPLNVHVNWYPISGTTSYFKYHPGKYLVAWHPKSSTDNERSTVVVKHPHHGEVLFRQIAGALARRICTYSRPGSVAAMGTEFGFIKFGSRVDVLLPLSATVEVELGQKVSGCNTVIARFES